MIRCLAFTSLLFLFGCSSNNFHNGFYKALVINPNNLYDTHYEVLRVDGNTINLSKYSYSGAFAGESIVQCEQYLDRIEFEEDGLTKVLQFRESDSSLMLNQLVVFKYMGDHGEAVVTRKEPLPLITKNSNGTITLLSNKKKGRHEEAASIPEDDIIPIGYYVETNENDPQTLTLYVKDGIYIIKKVASDNKENVLNSGTFRKDGRLIDLQGRVTEFKRRGEYLYRLKDKVWTEYQDQACGR